MVRGRDEAHNPNRRPQRPQTDEEKMAIVKQVFPNAQEVNVNENEEMDMDDDDYDYIDEWNDENPNDTFDEIPKY